MTAATGSAALLARLQTPEQTDPLWTALGLTGFVTFIVGTLCLLFIGLDEKLRPRIRRLLPLAALLLSGLLLFFFGMANA